MLTRFASELFPVALYPDDFLGEPVIWTNPDKGSFHLSLHDIRNLDQANLDSIAKLNKTNCLYISHSLFRPGLDERHRGGKKDAVAMPSFVLDVDLDDPEAHRTKDPLPRTDEDVLRILEPYPQPTIGVRSGHGWQFYWVFSEQVLLKNKDDRERAARAFEAFQQVGIAHAAGLGFHVDKTCSIDRVWRIPGYLNRKVPGKPVLVTWEFSDPAQHKPSELGLDLNLTHRVVSTPETRRPTTALSLTRARAILAKLENPGPFLPLMLGGKSFADKQRDDAMQSLAGTVAFALCRDKDDFNPVEIAELARPSLKVWADEPGATKTIAQEMAKMVEKLGRAKRDYAEKTTSAPAIAKALRIELGEAAPTEKHFIIQKGRAFYIIVPRDNIRYAGPMIRDEVVPFVKDNWPFETTYYNAKGEIKQMQVPMLMDQYGTVAEKVQGCLWLKNSKYDEKEATFHHVVAPLRKLEPRYDPQIDHWLRLLGKDQEHVDMVLDFVASVVRLDKPCAALALIGPPSTGKTTLADGLARLWRVAGPTRYQYSVGANFNQSIVDCPLIVLSEGDDDSRSGTSSSFRDLLGSQQFTINPKGFAPYSVVGCVRIILTANDDGILRDITGTRELSNESLSAVADRLAIIQVGREPREYMDSLKAQDPRTIDRWIHNDLLARHALWLRDNRTLSNTARFLVTGKVDSTLQRLVVHRAPSEALLEWIVGFATDPKPFEQLYKTMKRVPYSQIGNGKIRLNSKEIQETWGKYVDEKIAEKPSVTALGTMLSKLGNGSATIRVDGKQARVREIEPTYPINFSANNQIGDIEKIRENLARELEGDEQ